MRQLPASADDGPQQGNGPAHCHPGSGDRGLFVEVLGNLSGQPGKVNRVHYLSSFAAMP